MEENAKDIKNNIEDLISKSPKISRPGPTEYYKLVTEVQSIDKEGKMQKMTFGSKDPNKPNKTILVMGETGTGKSTIINTMVNYVLGIELEHEVWFEVVEEMSQSDETQSTTSEITVYEIFGYEGHVVPYSLTIIDTPGYGDTSGIQKDNRVTEKCLELFRSAGGIHEIHSVAFVFKASMNRLTDRQHYIFDAVLSMFGKDMVDNFVYLFTHSNGITPETALQALEMANIPFAKNDRNRPINFLFDNQKVIDTSCMSVRDAKKTKKSIERSWEVTKDGMEEFSEFLETVKPQSVKMSEGVLRERKVLEANINNLSEKVSFLEQNKQELKQYEKVVQTCKEGLKDTTREVEIEVSKKVKKDVDHWVTACEVCKENCHNECWWVNDLWWCSVMSWGKCTVCAGGCRHEEHKKEKKKYFLEKRRKMITEVDLKKKFELEGIIGTNFTMIGQIKERLVMTEKDIDKLLERSYNCVVELDKIALKTTSMSMVESVDKLIQWMTKKEDTCKVEKLKEIQKRMEEINKEGLSYFCRGWNYVKAKVTLQ